MTLLGLLAGGRGPIPAPSAIAGVVSRVGSLERSAEFHEQAILELERPGSEVECLVNHVKTLEQLLAQLQDIAFQTRDRSLTIAELCMNLETNVRDLQDFSTLVEEKQLSMAELHDDLKEKVLHVKQQVTSLEEWGNDITTNLNDIEVLAVRPFVLCSLLPTLSDHSFDDIHVFFITK